MRCASQLREDDSIWRSQIEAQTADDEDEELSECAELEAGKVPSAISEWRSLYRAPIQTYCLYIQAGIRESAFFLKAGASITCHSSYHTTITSRDQYFPVSGSVLLEL
jgi:hypothetical protein